MSGNDLFVAGTIYLTVGVIFSICMSISNKEVLNRYYILLTALWPLFGIAGVGISVVNVWNSMRRSDGNRRDHPR